MSSFYISVSIGCELSVDDFNRMGTRFKERGDMAMAGLAQAVAERLQRLVDNPSSETHVQISEDCGRSARAASQMADRFHELDEEKMEDVAETVARRLRQLTFDAMSETQPIERPIRKPPHGEG